MIDYLIMKKKGKFAINIWEIFTRVIEIFRYLITKKFGISIQNHHSRNPKNCCYKYCNKYNFDLDDYTYIYDK